MSIHPRGGKFGVKVYDPRVRRKVWAGTAPTREAAEKLERRKLRELAAAGKKLDGPETCDQFAERFIEDYCHGLEASTLKTYTYVASVFGRDFEGVKLTDIDRPAARRWAVKQPRNTQNVVRTMFTHARRDGLVDANPFAELGLKQSRGRRDLEPITLEQLHQLADAALDVHGDYGPMFRAFILFAGYTGMRPGEILALRWSHIDFENHIINVRDSLSTVNTIKRPKNGQARKIILPPPLVPVLAKLERTKGEPYVFTSKRGHRLTRPTLQPYWALVRSVAGVPIKDCYELRHFCATYLLEKGLSHADVAIQLGHTDGGALVMKVYGHPSADKARQRLLAAFNDDDQEAA